MYQIEKTFTISASHHLPHHPGKCQEVHGHNWKITVFCEMEELDPDTGMIADFGRIKGFISDRLDHGNLNEFIPNPTAERLAEWICNEIGPRCTKVRVEETEGSIAWYIR